MLFQTLFTPSTITASTITPSRPIRHQLFTLIAGLSASGLSFAQAHNLQLDIQGFEESGTCYIAIYNNAENFNSMNGKAVSKIQQQVKGGKLSITFHDLAEGEYAISLFHDANGNQKLDSNLLGIPSEQYGFSNNAGGFGPAKFKDAKFILKASQKHSIQLR